jgi:protein-disulfide isomerase
MKALLSTIAVAAIALTSLVPSVDAQQQSGTNPLIASVNGEAIMSSELENKAAARLLKAQSEEYNTRQVVLNEIIDNLLIRQEARRRGLASDQLLADEVYSRVPLITDAEVRAIVDNTPLAPTMVATDRLKAAATGLRFRRTEKLKADFVKSLRDAASISILLAPPRLERAIDAGYSIGLDSARVSIIEFSDFQCPYCSQLSAVLRRLRQELPTQVRITFVQFPLPSHPQARVAALAALCAGEQGRFWDMHDALFANQQIVAEGGFSVIGKKIALEEAAFLSCMESSAIQQRLARDQAEATSVSVNATPTMLINGRFVTGSMSYEKLRGVVDEELKGLAVPTSH